MINHLAVTLRRIVGWTLLAVMLGTIGQPPARGQQKAPRYPHVNTAIAYAVDAQWPQRPASLPWAEMPGITVDAHDRIWTFTRAVPAVQVYDADGKFERAWGDESLKGAHHIKIDHEGNVWLAVYASHVVQKYTPEGKLLLTIGTPNHAGRDQTHLDKPTDMAITPSGDIFISDGYGNARVVLFDKNGKYVKEWGELGGKPGQFSIPHAIAIDSQGRLYVADRNNVRIQVFDQNGKLLDRWENLVVPWGLAMTKNDELWVCGSSPTQWRQEDSNLGVPPKDQVFMKFNTQGKLLQLWTVPKGVDGLEKPGECNWVHCIAVDSKDNLYVGDIRGKRAQKFVRKKP
jgi:DNA-binding beta-propeller fold protein YncE